MKKVKLKTGDIFSVRMNETFKRYFQFVGNDISQLNSDVIRVFKNSYSMDESPDLRNIVNDKVDFYAHVILKLGIRMNIWINVGNVFETGNFNEVLFRDSSDYGDPNIKISNNWWIWKMNEPQKFVGNLIDVYQKAEIGVIVRPQDVVDRMCSGKYKFNYPEYE